MYIDICVASSEDGCELDIELDSDEISEGEDDYE